MMAETVEILDSIMGSNDLQHSKKCFMENFYKQC